MSVAFRGTSEEVEGDSSNLMTMENRSNYGWQSRGLVCWIVAAAVCIGLLLLTMILVANNTSTINHWDAKYNDLVYEITKGRDALIDERDQLKIHSNNLTQEMEGLQRKYNSMVTSRDELKEEVDGLRLNRTDNSCFQGWIEFNNKCYYVSPDGQTKTWAESRKDCQARGADLVRITSTAELDFVMGSYDLTWIGLTRGEEEGKWKWVDGTEVVDSGLWQQGEPNNSDGNEDCVEVSRDASALNDVPCSRKFSWVCED